MKDRSGSHPIKVLYAAYRHDPRDPDRASGADYRFAQALEDQGFDLCYAGPVLGLASPVERLLRRIYRHLSQRDYTKFPLSLARRSSRQLQRTAEMEKPDLIFTLFPPPLVFFRGEIPILYRLDTTFLGWHQQYPEFGELALKLSLWQERRALARAHRLITHSAWTRDLLINNYAQPTNKIHVWPNPASLPKNKVPGAFQKAVQKVPGTFQQPTFQRPMRLLMVGRHPKRKGLDLGLEIFHQLKRAGIEVELTVCGVSGEDEEGLRFVGTFRKSIASELEAYVDLYRNADLLLHPARFDPSPIVVSEAAAFGVPTVTNACGGLATSVLDGETGIVLPHGSEPAAYVETIQGLLSDPEHYRSLCRGARRRYELELNWEVLGNRLGALVRETVNEARKS